MNGVVNSRNLNENHEENQIKDNDILLSSLVRSSFHDQLTEKNTRKQSNFSSKNNLLSPNKLTATRKIYETPQKSNEKIPKVANKSVFQEKMKNFKSICLKSGKDSEKIDFETNGNNPKKSPEKNLEEIIKLSKTEFYYIAELSIKYLHDQQVKIKEIYVKILTQAIGRGLSESNQNYIQDSKAFKHANEKLTRSKVKRLADQNTNLLGQLYMFVKKYIDEADAKKNLEMNRYMVEDYDILAKHQQKALKNSILKKYSAFKKIEELEKLIQEKSIFNETLTESYHIELDSLKVDIESLVDVIKEKNDVINKLLKENAKKDEEIQDFMEQNQDKNLVERKMVDMGKVFFRQISQLMNAYSETVSFLDFNSDKLNRNWSDIKRQIKNVNQKHESEFGNFFKSAREMVENYDILKKKVNIDLVKNLIEDFQIKKANLELQIEKKRYLHKQGFDVPTHKQDKSAKIKLMDITKSDLFSVSSDKNKIIESEKKISIQGINPINLKQHPNTLDFELQKNQVKYPITSRSMSRGPKKIEFNDKKEILKNFTKKLDNYLVPSSGSPNSKFYIRGSQTDRKDYKSFNNGESKKQLQTFDNETGTNPKKSFFRTTNDMSARIADKSPDPGGNPELTIQKFEKSLKEKLAIRSHINMDLKNCKDTDSTNTKNTINSHLNGPQKNIKETVPNLTNVAEKIMKQTKKKKDVLQNFKLIKKSTSKFIRNAGKVYIDQM